MTAPTDTPDLAVAVTAHNSMRTIECTVQSVREVARRIVVVDSGSTDGTIETCRRLGAEVIEKPWAGHVEQKQFAIDQCSEHAWVLLLDSDESIEAELAASMLEVLREDDPACDGWAINRKVWFLGGWLHHMYQPEWRLRLVRGGRGRVVGEGVHDRLDVGGRTGRLRGVCRHDSWADVRDLAERQIRYAETAAAAGHGARGGTALHLLFSPPAAMLKQLVLKRGFLDGGRGLIAAGLTFNATMLKHALIAARRLRNAEMNA